MSWMDNLGDAEAVAIEKTGKEKVEALMERLVDLRKVKKKAELECMEIRSELEGLCGTADAEVYHECVKYHQKECLSIDRERLPEDRSLWPDLIRVTQYGVYMPWKEKPAAEKKKTKKKKVKQKVDRRRKSQ